MADQALLDVLRRSGAVQYGEFELAHGGTSEYYIDKYVFETDPDSLARIARALTAKVGDETLAGVALGAVPLVAVTSIESGNPYVIVRKSEKEYGTGNRIEGELSPGDRVVVIEDVTTTGRSARAAVEGLRAAGATVDRLLVVVDREQGARERLADIDVELEPLVSATELLAAEGR